MVFVRSTSSCDRAAFGAVQPPANSDPCWTTIAPAQCMILSLQSQVSIMSLVLSSQSPLTRVSDNILLSNHSLAGRTSNSTYPNRFCLFAFSCSAKPQSRSQRDCRFDDRTYGPIDLMFPLSLQADVDCPWSRIFRLPLRCRKRHGDVMLYCQPCRAPSAYLTDGIGHPVF
jgi:hypothetical protein